MVIALGRELPENEMKERFDDYDTDKNNKIDFQEFSKALSMKCSETSEPEPYNPENTIKELNDEIEKMSTYVQTSIEK